MKESNLPSAFIARMRTQLDSDAEAYFDALQQSSPTSIRLHHRKGHAAFPLNEKVPWCELGYYLTERPSFHLDPHWHGGAYYVQEASSMIMDAVLDKLPLDDDPKIWLDLCAAPGGKTGILAKHMSRKDVLIANEVVSSRRNVLRENLIKGGFPNTGLTGLDAASFPSHLADVILIDAPCAGEGMMRKEPEAIRQWSPQLVSSCSLLQKQILQNAIRILKPGGFLIYSTCSYSQEENMQNASLAMSSGELKNLSVELPATWNITPLSHQEAIGYQLYPHRVKGEGLFFTVFHKKPQTLSGQKKSKTLFQSLPVHIAHYIDLAEDYISQRNSPTTLFTAEAEVKADEVMKALPKAEWITQVGEFKRNDFIPSHFLAMSGLYGSSFPRIEVELDQALDYLERKIPALDAGSASGWHVMVYQNTVLGWMKRTPQGWKNYYPLPWRLRNR